MMQQILLIAGIMILMSNSTMALNDIDKSVLRNCADDCNGESPNCNDCYERSIELNDQSVYDIGKTPNALEIDF